MSNRLAAVLDHVAIAVPAWDAAERRWREQCGGGVVAFGKTPGFWSRQLRFANGGKLELLSPPPDADEHNFVRRFLDRFGAEVHHVTLKVPDLPRALDTLEAAGLEAVDVRLDGEYWREAFLRPSVVGGIVVQVAWSATDDEAWARRVGHTPEPPRPDAMALQGPLLTHPDLDEAAALWQVLGAEIVHENGALVCHWPKSPLTVRIEAGPEAKTFGLRGGRITALPADPQMGPELRIEAE